ETADEEILTSERRSWPDRLEAEQANLRAALGWCQEHDPALGLRLANGLGRFWHIRGNRSEGHRWLTSLLPAAPEGSLLRARGLLRLSSVAGHSQGAIEPVEEGRAV